MDHIVAVEILCCGLVCRRCAVNRRDIRCADQQLVRRHDGEIALGIADAVVVRCQTTGLQRACVGASTHVGAGVGAGDVQRSAQHAGVF